MLQAGDPIVSRDASSGLPKPVLSETAAGRAKKSRQLGAQFYTEFANPSKKRYIRGMWTRVVAERFVAGDLAMYLGRSSDYATIANRNPNLHFAVALGAPNRGWRHQEYIRPDDGRRRSRSSPNQKRRGSAVALKLTLAARYWRAPPPTRRSRGASRT